MGSVGLVLIMGVLITILHNLKFSEKDSGGSWKEFEDYKFWNQEE